MKGLLQREILPSPDKLRAIKHSHWIGKTHPMHVSIIFYFCRFQGGRDEEKL